MMKEFLIWISDNIPIAIAGALATVLYQLARHIFRRPRFPRDQEWGKKHYDFEAESSSDFDFDFDDSAELAPACQSSIQPELPDQEADEDHDRSKAESSSDFDLDASVELHTAVSPNRPKPFLKSVSLILQKITSALGHLIGKLTKAIISHINLKAIGQWLLHFLVYIVLVFLIMIAYCRIILAIRSTGQLSLDLNNISCIHMMKYDSLQANFTSKTSPIIYIDNDIRLTSDKPFQVQDKSNNWIDVDSVLIKPISNSASISLNSYTDELFYNINANSIPETSYSQLVYSMSTEKQYVYHITAPEITCSVDLPLNYESFIISPSDCELIYSSNGVATDSGSRIQFPVSAYNVNPTDTSLAKCSFILQQEKPDSSGISIAISPEPVMNPTQHSVTNTINVANLQELDMNCSGTSSWSYGELIEETLHNNRLHFVVDDKVKTPDANDVLTRHGIVSSSSLYPDTVFTISKSDASQVIQLKIDSSVKKYSLDSIDQFPNIYAYLVKNWKSAIGITIVFNALGYIFPYKKKEST